MNSGFVYPDYKNLLYTKEAVVTFTRKTSNDFTSNSQLIQKTINNLFFSSGTVFLYFDTRCPFSLRSSALICQRTTQTVILVFTAELCTADVYLDDFHGIKHSSTPSSAPNVFKNYWINWVYKHLLKKIVHPLHG